MTTSNPNKLPRVITRHKISRLRRTEAEIIARAEAKIEQGYSYLCRSFNKVRLADELMNFHLDAAGAAQNANSEAVKEMHLALFQHAEQLKFSELFRLDLDSQMPEAGANGQGRIHTGASFIYMPDANDDEWDFTEVMVVSLVGNDRVKAALSDAVCAQLLAKDALTEAVVIRELLIADLW